MLNQSIYQMLLISGASVLGPDLEGMLRDHPPNINAPLHALPLPPRRKRFLERFKLARGVLFLSHFIICFHSLWIRIC